MIYRIDEAHHHQKLVSQANQLVHRKMTRLLWNHIDLMSAEIEGDSVGQLYGLANHLRQTCNRVVVLALQSEFTHLIVTKSADIPHLYVDEILDVLSKDYGGQYSKDQAFGHGTFYQQDIIPELIDRVVESIVIALPYEH